MSNVLYKLFYVLRIFLINSQHKRLDNIFVFVTKSLNSVLKFNKRVFMTL